LSCFYGRIRPKKSAIHATFLLLCETLL